MIDNNRGTDVKLVLSEQYYVDYLRAHTVPTINGSEKLKTSFIWVLGLLFAI